MGTIKQLLKGFPVTVREEDTLGLARHTMLWGDLRHLPVVEGRALVGVLTEGDVLRRFAEVGPGDGALETVGAVMSTPPVTIGPDGAIGAALALVTKRGIGCLPVVERGQLVGLITRRDLLAEGVEASAEEHRPTLNERSRWTNLVVDDVMSRDPFTASPDDTIDAVIERMGRHGIRHLPVVDGSQRVVGMLSDRDIRTAVGNPLLAVNSRDAALRMESTRVSQAMTGAPVMLASGTRLSRAATLFADYKIGAVPIVDAEEHVVGLVSYTDVLRAVLGPKPNVS